MHCNDNIKMSTSNIKIVKTCCIMVSRYMCCVVVNFRVFAEQLCEVQLCEELLN